MVCRVCTVPSRHEIDPSKTSSSSIRAKDSCLDLKVSSSSSPPITRFVFFLLLEALLFGIS